MYMCYEAACFSLKPVFLLADDRKNQKKKYCEKKQSVNKHITMNISC